MLKPKGEVPANQFNIIYNENENICKYFLVKCFGKFVDLATSYCAEVAGGRKKRNKDKISFFS